MRIRIGLGDLPEVTATAGAITTYAVRDGDDAFVEIQAWSVADDFVGLSMLGDQARSLAAGLIAAADALDDLHTTTARCAELAQRARRNSETFAVLEFQIAIVAVATARPKAPMSAARAARLLIADGAAPDVLDADGVALAIREAAVQMRKERRS